jgi:hypothetical protein
MAFTKWSDINPDAKRILRPDLGLRDWDAFNSDEKLIFIKHLHNSRWLKSDHRTYLALQNLNQAYKTRNLCPNLLTHGGPHKGGRYGQRVSSCCTTVAENDAFLIMSLESSDVFYELISFYAEVLTKDSDKETIQRFCRCINDLSEQFGLNIVLTPTSILPRQERKITTQIYEPALQVLADAKWKEVSRELADAFEDFQRGTPDSYSNCITHAVTAIQAFLQVLVHGKTGKGDISPLLATASSQGLIPHDVFSQKILRDIQSALMAERQAKGDPHPKAEYADRKAALLVLNITMVFLQHCLQES